MRGFRDDDDGGGSRQRNRGGAAMSPTTSSVPNYMRGTSSSDAKSGHRARALLSASPPRRRPVRVVTRAKVLFPKVTGLGRSTCSSTMKEAKFPDALDLSPGATDAEGPAAMRVCPYTYCSLNGHVHSLAVPLGSFLASRRRLIKTQQSMKLKGVSAFRKSTGHQRSEDKNGAAVCRGGGGAKVAPLIDAEALGDFFVEVYAGPRVSMDMSCSDMSLDEMDATVRKMEFVVFDRCVADEGNEKGDDLDVYSDGDPDGRLEERFGAYGDNSSECSDASISGEFVEELPWMRYQGYEDDSLDDEFSDEQRIRDEEITEAVISEEQEGQDEEGTPGRLGDDCEEKAARKQKASDEQNISEFAHESETAAELEGVDFRIGAFKEQEEINEDNILDAVYQREVSTEQETQEEKNLVAICKLEIPEQEVADSMETILDESCKEETSMEQEQKGDRIDMEPASKESDATQQTTSDDNSAPLTDCAQTELGMGTSELMGGREESGIAQETGQDDNAEYVSYDDGQNATMITTSQLEVASEESVTAQDADDNSKGADDNSKGVRDGAQNESEQMTCESAYASEEFDVTHGTNQNDNAAYFNHGTLEESAVITSESEVAHEESDLAREGDEEDYSAGINAGAQKEVKLNTCESRGASEGTIVPQESDGCVNTIDLNDSAKKEITVSILGACEEVCITEETSQSSNMQVPELNYNISTTKDREESKNKDTLAKESFVDDICNAFSGMQLKGDVYLDPTESVTCPSNRLIIARRRRTPGDEEYLKGFHPRAPNFLPLELDPEAEKVDLKHQMMDERKNAEEWMIDYALRRAVNNLGPAQKKKVELLVQAFETVLPHDEHDKKKITPTRPVQACN